ncbi:MAG TPA: alpha-mannosidase [Ktedonobacterales bacterium]|nr:alpha-mannosidase [Ktedonobacterales bacterium]
MQRLRRALIELAPRIYPESRLLRNLRLFDLGSGIDPREMPIPSSESGDWASVHTGSRWGGHDRTAWFHAVIETPSGWLAQLDGGEGTVVLRLLLGQGSEFGWPEGLLYVNARLQQGINRHHADVLLRADDIRSGELTFDVRAWSGMLPQDHRIELAEIALLDRPTERFYHLLSAGADLVDALDERDPLCYALASTLDAAYDTVNLSPSDFYPSIRVAVAQVDADLLELSQRFQPATRPSVTAVGHGHLDVAWLWQTRHTREKAARTFSIATALMDAYPEYVFLHTTPQVFSWLKDDYPALFERVRLRIEEGRFEAAGAMWVESDCNLVSGESLVRQIHYGQRFLREEFGREYAALWLPDAFGYSAALPQIMLRAGIPVFMTTKLSWSETNRIPADTFRWRGIDGSTVLAHFITTPTLGAPALFANMDTYNGSLNVEAVRGVWDRYRQKALIRETLLAFGHGDGGAGPTRQHLEQARAMQQLPGMPELRLGRADEYFERLLAAVAKSSDVPLWDGDLYLEYHRGTYTTQSWLKRMHRQLEGALLMAEWLDAWNWSLNPAQAPDYRVVLDDAWRTLLMHEFHDILPGSSIATVYWDARLALTELAEKLHHFTVDSLKRLVGDVPRDTTVALNPSPFARTELLAFPDRGDGGFPHAAGRRLPTQRVAAEDAPTVLVELPDVPGRELLSIDWVADPSEPDSVLPEPQVQAVEAGEDGTGIWLKNAFFTVRLNAGGEIVSLRDHRVADGDGREVIPAGERANVLTAYEDLPREFDAWDIDAYYVRKPYPLETIAVTLVERGPLRAVARVERRFRTSTILQRIALYHANPRIDFETHIDWHEQHVLLKAGFGLNIRAPHVTCETQYGAIERPVDRNTSWEQARFEMPAHRWIDISEGDYGVSLLNDGLYGHDVGSGHLGLTLLRSPTFPDPQADQGAHDVTYSLYPHLGDWRTGGTVAAAYALNRPLVTLTVAQRSTVGDGDPAEIDVRVLMAAIFTVDLDNVVIEAIKRSQDGEGIIVRLFEAFGNRVRAHIHSALPVANVVECDLLERTLAPESSPAHPLWITSPAASHDPPEVDAHGWSCMFGPFEVRTFLVRLAT